MPKTQGTQTGSVYAESNKHKKVQFARIRTAYKLQYFHNQNSVSVSYLFSVPV